ncbi:hypothetical protein [Jeotgalibacillus salarius]|uniref:Uncharacterized protein n=1 Tax=Jeotgalibacillus salarius TaxID=546023 RepID=A0A4Y8LFY6_9BACL|nr:hypothetical protein [Jeotgalibacillus salarius]TFD99426.1 hypothetical protein E2626_14300 [Jeotgalibacillus salarius]
MGKTISGAILIMTAAILYIGYYITGAIMVNAQGVSSPPTLVTVARSMTEEIPLPYYLSIASLILGIFLLILGIAEEFVKKKS